MTRLLSLVLVVLSGCGGRPMAPPAATAGPTAAPADATAVAADALCCCTFDGAEAEDFPDVARWDSLARTCPTGDGVRMPGQCIDWHWCGYAPGREPRSLADRPDLAPPPPLTASQCCCDTFDGAGETFAVLDAIACAARPQATCVDAGFCDRLPVTPR